MGMRVVEVTESEYVSGRLSTEVWEITAEEWRTWRQSGSERIVKSPAQMGSSAQGVG